MPRRYRRDVRINQIGETKGEGRRGRIALVLSVPAASLLLPAFAVAVANTGGNSEPVRVSHDVEQFMLFYSGVFALVFLTAAVGVGLLATDRLVMRPEQRIMAQGAHRMISLVAVSALANHVMLEILAHRVRLIDGFVPFLASQRTFFMGLGTVASDLLILVIITGLVRARFASGSRTWVWRMLHGVAYVVWPLSILHGLLAGRSAKPYVDWSYGACAALVVLGLIMRLVLQARGRNSAHGFPVRGSAPVATRPAAMPDLTPLAGRFDTSAAQLMATPWQPGARGPGQQPRALPAGNSARGGRPRDARAPGWPAPEGYQSGYYEYPPDYVQYPPGYVEYPPDYYAERPGWNGAGYVDGEER
jgi:DMSO/TMAO reductase YedYZ heme-binding membrane subunit